MLASSIPPSLIFLLFLPAPPTLSADVIVTSDPLTLTVNLDGAPLSHLLLDSGAGRLYVGGVDHLYQLTSDLEMISHVRTGPHLDSPDCLPPIVPQDCPSATPTHNHNKLLLMEGGQGVEPGSLIVCGSLYQGICEKRSLSNISQIIYQTSNPVDTQYVAANDPRVSTVAVVITVENKQEMSGMLHLMLVGRGYTSKGPGDIPPITTRRLFPVVPPPFSQEEELGKLVVGSYSEYNNHFVKAVTHGEHVYFLFSRRDMWHKKEYRTYASRLCASDRSFYSYVEVPLLCHGGYNLAQAAWLGNHSGEPALFVVMAVGQASTPVATGQSALCVYGMAKLDAMLRQAQEVCYTEGGRGSSGQEEAYIEYAVSSKLNTGLILSPFVCKVSLLEYPCGGEHTPNPIASAVPLPATPTFSSSTLLTAVTTATEAGHTIAFLGDREGKLHKVTTLSQNEWCDLYDSVVVDICVSVVVYLLTDVLSFYLSQLSKLSVLSHRCCRKHQCQRHLQSNHWLWSFESTKQCVTVQTLQPANQSKDEQTQVTLSVIQLPNLTKAESLFCVFGLLQPQPAIIMGTSITCQTPAPELLPDMPAGSDHMVLPVSLKFGHVTITTGHLTFYDYSLSVCLSVSPCVFCLSPVSPCLSCLQNSPGPSLCPLVFSMQSSALVPMGLSSSVVLQGRNLDVFTVRTSVGSSFLLRFICGEERDASTQLVSTVRHNFLPLCLCVCVCVCVCLMCVSVLCSSVQLYDCSAGQSDCSQCRAVPDEYGCVWCPGSPSPSCVYNQSCSTTPADTCPPPQITQVLPVSGPLEGGVLVTITGSNLGMRYQDVVGGVTDPRLIDLVPDKGPISGGTRLTIRGQQLLTGQMSDLSAFLGPQPRGDRCGGKLTRRLCLSICSGPDTTNPSSCPDVYLSVHQGLDLTRAMSRQEVRARLGDQECDVKTLDNTHLYCEPPEIQPMSVDDGNELPALQVFMGNLQVDLGLVQYDSDSLLSPVPLAAQISLAAGAAVIILSVRKSKQALRDYKKVLLQLETLEINVGDQCRKEFTDLMTEMMDLSSDVGGPGLPLLDYRTYAERVFFPGQQTALLSRQLDLPESRRPTVEQGLQQLNNLLNNRLFLSRFIHTLEAQQGFSQRDRGYVASLLTIALHDKLEYFTEVMKNLLQDLVQQYVAKNPKLMLRRTETVVEKMLTNWMSICLYSFLKEVAGEPLYMLYRAIKYQVDKGPVDAVTGKAKRTLNDSHLLREDIDFCTMTLTVLVKNGVEVQPCPVKVLDTDTITQVKDKIMDQVYRGAPFSQRPAADSLDLEWRSGQAGHLTLSDDDVTAVVQGRWKRINTLQHYKVPDGATVALIPRSQSGVGVNQVFQTGEKTPMLEGEEEEGLRLWHLVKSSEDPEIPKHRKSSMRERERAKAIPEIYLTRLLSMKGTLQKFVDDVFVAILSTKRPPPIAVRFFFDFLDDMAEKHGIDDPETVHIWKTNSLPLRFWVNILKNPQFVLDVQVTDSIDAILSVIAQTFIDSCTTSEHKVGRVRLRLHPSVSLSLNSIIMSLEEDSSGQKMQLAYRLQQVAALVENKVTDL
uniref:Plexin B3 n=1 Tax=Scophthalmus maximus TaxID=52904 RepID=A0A8D3AMV0_SCOMX